MIPKRTWCSILVDFCLLVFFITFAFSFLSLIFFPLVRMF